MGAEAGDDMRLKGVPGPDDGISIEFLLDEKDGQALLWWLARRGVRPVAVLVKRSEMRGRSERTAPCQGARQAAPACTVSQLDNCIYALPLPRERPAHARARWRAPCCTIEKWKRGVSVSSRGGASASLSISMICAL